MSNILTPGLMPNSLTGIQTAFDAGTAGEKSTFQAAVSGAETLPLGNYLTSTQLAAGRALQATDITDAMLSCVAEAKAQRIPISVPVGYWRLSDTIDCRCTLTVGGTSQNDDFKGIYGPGMQGAIFEFMDLSKPGFRFSGRYFALDGFTARYASIASLADTTADVFSLEDWVLFCTFSRLIIQNGYTGWNNKDGDRTDIGPAMFSNSYDTIRFLNNRYIHWIDSAATGPSNGGTGSSARNIYMSSQGVDRMFRAYQRFGGLGGHFSQLNIEQTTFQDSAIYDTGGTGLLIDSLHLEGNKFLGGQGTRALVATNATGTLRISALGIDECHVGPMAVASITRSGSVATIVFDLLSKTNGGHPFRVGDAIYVDGAGEPEYNGSKTVVTVPNTTSITFTVVGTPATPAVLASGVDVITCALGGDANSNGIAVVKGLAGCESIVVDDLTVRDVRVIGKNASARDTTFRFSAAESEGTRISIPRTNYRGQVANASLLGALEVVGLARDANVARAWTRLRHKLKIGDSVFISTSATGFHLARTVVAVPTPNSFTYNSLGANMSLFAAPESSALLCKTYGTVSKERTNGIASVTLDADPALRSGHRVRVANINGSGGTFSATDLMLKSVSGRVISYRSIGVDEGPTVDSAGVVMLLDAGITPNFLSTPSASTALDACGDFLNGFDVLDLGPIAAFGSASVTRTHKGASLGRPVGVRSVGVAGMFIIATALQDQVTFTCTNITADSITGVVPVSYALL